MKILGISGTIVGSKPTIVLHYILDKMKEIEPDLEVGLLDLKEYDLQFCDGRDQEDYNDDTKKVIDLVSEADGYIVSTPIFHCMMPGTLKNLFDLIPKEVWKDKPMGFAAVGNNDKHYLIIEYHLKPLAGYLQSIVTSNNVYVHNEDFDDGKKIINTAVLEGIEKLAQEIVKRQRTFTSN